MGHGPSAVDFLGSGDCSSHIPCVLVHVVRVENEIHIVHIAGWLHAVKIFEKKP